ncbi:MAG: hypothetical protein QM811_06730 [Pirellulales bacterium]
MLINTMKLDGAIRSLHFYLDNDAAALIIAYLPIALCVVRFTYGLHRLRGSPADSGVRFFFSSSYFAFVVLIAVFSFGGLAILGLRTLYPPSADLLGAVLGFIYLMSSFVAIAVTIFSLLKSASALRSPGVFATAIGATLLLSLPIIVTMLVGVRWALLNAVTLIMSPLLYSRSFFLLARAMRECGGSDSHEMMFE